MKDTLRCIVMVAIVLASFWVSVAQAQTQAPESAFTPGPRMISFLEKIAQEYETRDQALNLSPDQKRVVNDLLRGFKKEMWLKEAVLVGIFGALEDKRRYGLLNDHIDYRTANTLTGGIETDELSLFIDTLGKLQAILTKEQRAWLKQLWHPTLSLRVPEGLTTRIALMSLQGIGRIYNNWREELTLTDTQASTLRVLLEQGRADILKMGTAVDVNRAEGDDLTLTPDVDPEQLREKMTKSGDLEAGVFTTLFELSDKADAILTAEQKKTLQSLKHNHMVRAGGGAHRMNHGNGYQSPDQANGAINGSGRFEYFLDQIGPLHLSSDQVSRLVALKEETRKALLLDQAKLKGAELDLLSQLDGTRAVLSAEQLTDKVRQLEEFRGRITHARVAAYLKARQILRPEQSARVPPEALLEGLSGNS